MNQEFWNNIYKLYGIVLDLRELLGKIINGRLGEYDRLDTKPSLNEIKQGDKVEIHWQDASSCPHGVHSLEEAQVHSGADARTVGYVLKEDASCIVVGMTNFYHTELPSTETAEEGFKFIWTIPKGIITSIKKQGDIEGKHNG